MRLYCLPHAGASASAYRSWPGQAPPGVHVVGLDLPGRGTRAKETAADDYRSLVKTLAEHVINDLDGAAGPAGLPRYATFGHSFGAMLALAVGAAVADALGEAPVGAMLSAALPPRLMPADDDLAALDDAALLERMAADGGTPPELLASSAMAARLVRLLRQDLAIRPQFRADISLRVPFPLVLLAAQADVHVTPERMRAWTEHSDAHSRFVTIPGDHFAAMRQPRETMAIMRREMGW